MINTVSSPIDLLWLSMDAEKYGKLCNDGSFKASNKFNISAIEVGKRERFTNLIIEHVRDIEISNLDMRTIRNIKPLKFSNLDAQGNCSITGYGSSNLKLIDAYRILCAVFG